METCKIIVVIAIFALSTACIASGAQANSLVITKADDGKEITVPKGGLMEVRLKQSGGTGYLWQIVDPDETRMKVLGSADIPLNQDKIVGAPLVRTWKIQAVESGQTELKFLLYRSWEGIGSAVDRFHVKILIK